MSNFLFRNPAVAFARDVPLARTFHAANGSPEANKPVAQAFQPAVSPTFQSAVRWIVRSGRRLENLRYGRLESLRYVFGRTELALSLSLCFASAHGAEPTNSFSKGPFIQLPAPGQATVMWESPTNALAVVHYGAGLSLDQELSRIVPEQITSETSGTVGTKTGKTRKITFFLYKARISGLKPGTAYSYAVEFDGQNSAPQQFRTLDPAATSTRFIVYGDSRSDPKKHSALTAQFDRHQPDFILHTGDLVAKGQDYSLWYREFFGPAGNVIDHIPFFSVIGNHEQDGTNYLNYFDLPGNRLWYSFDAGPVHVLALDFRSERAKQEQFKFAQRDLLNSHAPWKLVVLHTPLFNIGGHASAWGHKDYLPLFHRAEVDLVLAGHSHLYERFRPLVGKRGSAKWPILHVTTGGGGASLHTALSHPSLVRQETTNHFMVFEATKERLHGEAFRVDGSLIDSFTVEKQRGHMTGEYLASAYPEPSLNLFFELAPALAARAMRAPTAVASTQVRFKLPPRQKGLDQARMEIHLTPESAAYYRLVDEPLVARTAPKGLTNEVWVQVMATGRTNITTTQSGELNPPLAFQAWIKAPEGETLAYGAKTRLLQTTNTTSNATTNATTSPK